MKLLDFLLLLLLVCPMAPAQHHALRVPPERARPVVRVLRSPQAPKMVRRVSTLPTEPRLPLPAGTEPLKEGMPTHL